MASPARGQKAAQNPGLLVAKAASAAVKIVLAPRVPAAAAGSAEHRAASPGLLAVKAASAEAKIVLALLARAAVADSRVVEVAAQDREAPDPADLAGPGATAQAVADPADDPVADPAAADQVAADQGVSTVSRRREPIPPFSFCPQ